MHATMRTLGPAEPGRGIRGTFYPSQSGGSMGAVVPKVIAIVVAMAVVRAIVAGKRHAGGSGRWSRRREAMAELHRELHAADDASAPAA